MIPRLRANSKQAVNRMAIDICGNCIDSFKLTCTRSGSKLQVAKHSRIAPINQLVDQRTCSEHLMITPFPAKMAERIGDQALWRAVDWQLLN